MDITPLIKPGQQIIQNYSPGGFKISGKTFNSPVMVSAGRAEKWSVPDDLEKLSDEHIEILSDMASDKDVLLLGTGKEIFFLSRMQKNAFREKLGLSPEIMTTGAACRTYNVLISEHRRVLAAMLPE